MAKHAHAGRKHPGHSVDLSRFERFFESSFRINLGERPFQIFGTGLEPFMMGAAVLLMYWLILYWMYRRKLFLKV